MIQNEVVIHYNLDIGIQATLIYMGNVTKQTVSSLPQKYKERVEPRSLIASHMFRIIRINGFIHALKNTA